jgi:hypothetical protein
MEHCVDADVWALEEFGGARLGDARRTRRLVQIACGAAGSVGAALSSVCGKSGAQTVTRLFGREETTLESVTRPHVIQTRDRCAGQGRLLAIQDTTVLDFTAHSSIEGIGPVTTVEDSRGLLLHTVLCVSADRVPLGILGMQLWTRDPASRGCAKDRRNRPVSEKESRKWLVGLEQAQQATEADQRLLVVGDRESDVYALFVAPRRSGVDLLIRLAHNRAVVDDEYGYVREALEAASIVGTYEVEIPRQGSRPKRTAKLDVRVARVSLRAPRTGRKSVGSEPIEVCLVWALERDAPRAGQALDWTLLTTELVDSYELAVEMIRSYTARWVIEEFHRVLKSGCRVEQMQFDTVERLSPAVGILTIVAWRVLYLTKYARSDPESDVGKVASAEEVEVLSRWLQAKGEKSYVIYTLKEFNIAVARLGGFLGRKSDGMPGTKTTWQGLRSLEILVLGYRLAAQHEM